MDKLEKYIKGNREELDLYEPGQEVWTKISNNIGSRRRSVSMILLRAAMVIAILSSAIVIYMAGKNSGLLIGGRPYNGNDPGFTELRETESYYTRKVNYLIDRVEPFLASDPETTRELAADLGKLDSLCLEIKQDLRDQVSNREVIEALVLNYRIKVQILEEMLRVMNEEDIPNINSREEDEI